MNGHLQGEQLEQPQLGDLLTIVANYLVNGMIVQVRCFFCLKSCRKENLFSPGTMSGREVCAFLTRSFAEKNTYSYILMVGFVTS